jgi:hypothetical protein
MPYEGQGRSAMAPQSMDGTPSMGSLSSVRSGRLLPMANRVAHASARRSTHATVLQLPAGEVTGRGRSASARVHVG